jgi:trk system potassium uptake protein TrkA
LCGKSISDSKLVDGISIGAIVRNNKVIYPTSETVISSGDHVILLAEKTAMKEIETLFSVSSDYF